MKVISALRDMMEIHRLIDPHGKRPHKIGVSWLVFQALYEECMESLTPDQRRSRPPFPDQDWCLLYGVRIEREAVTE